MKKTDTTQITQTNKEQSDKWVIALNLLFRACEPLTYDCLRTVQEQKDLEKDIEKHTLYCDYVKECIERGYDPMDWDAWAQPRSFSECIGSNGIIGNHNTSSVSAVSKAQTPVDLADTKHFGDLLTSLFSNRRY